MPAVPIGDIVALIEGEYTGDPGRLIAGVQPLGEAKSEHLSFLSAPRYEHLLDTSEAGAILVSREHERNDERFIRVANPYVALARILSRWFAEVPRPPVGVSPTAQIGANVTIGDGARIGANVVIEERVVIGRDVTIGAGTVIGPDSVVGDETTIHANVTIYHRTLVGRRCIIHSGVVLGADGFGFTESGGVHLKIPQVGIVRIEDDVEIGAGSMVDRATLGETVVGQGTKIDNLVQIGHNSKIGKHCLLAAGVGIGGSTETGDYVMFGGHSGAGGHVSIASRVKVGAKSAVMRDIRAEEVLAGFPARPLKEHLRSEAMVRRLPKLLERLERVEQQLGMRRERK